MRRKGMFLLAGLALTSACVAFLSFAAVASARPNSEKASSPGAASVSVASLADAEQIAGYSVQEPEFVPDGFSISSISVTQLQTVSSGPDSRPVEINWTSADGSWISMVQLPKSLLAPRGQAVVIGNVQGTETLYDAQYGRPPMVSLRWQIGQKTYGLTGLVKGSMTDKVLVEMAASVD